MIFVTHMCYEYERCEFCTNITCCHTIRNSFPISDMDILNYTTKDIYKCVLQTSDILNVDVSTIINTLSTFDEFKNIKSIINPYRTKLEHPSRNLTFLSGPNTFIFFKDIAGKRILLLGEYHTIKASDNGGICSNSILEKKGAYEVQKWIVDVCKNSEECIDVFTETPYKTNLNLPSCGSDKSLSKYDNPLYAITCELEELRKHDALPHNMRYHNIDIRKIKNANTLNTNTVNIFPTTELYEIAKGNASVKLTPQIIANYKVHKVMILSYLLGINRTEYAKGTYRSHVRMLFDLYNEPLFESNLDESEEKYFTIIDKEMSKIDPVIFGVPSISRVDEMESNIAANKQRFLYTLLSIYLPENMFTALMSIPMDLYFLARLFIKFNKNNRENGDDTSICSTSIYNAIVCAGDAHIRFYRIFFERYFNVRPSLVVESESKSQCLKIPNFDYFA